MKSRASSNPCNLFGMKKPKRTHFNPKQLKAGVRVEHEHTRITKMAECIAKIHLSEDPQYYIKLRKMEAGK